VRATRRVCSDKVELMWEEADSWPNNTIFYDPMGPNSNAVASWINTKAALGANPPANALGWEWAIGGE
jgi:hypothetical protein